MQYRKLNVVKPLLITLLSIGLLVISTVRADTTSEGNGAMFKGPTSTCVRHSPAIYPCIFLTPPAYRSKPGIGIVFTGATPYLPLDSGVNASETDSDWLARLKNGEIGGPQLRLSPQLHDMNMNFTVEDSGAVVNMGMGLMKFHVYVDDSRLSESRFFLGIDRSW